MAALTATFELIDRVSDKLDSMASSGNVLSELFDETAKNADDAFDTIESGSQRAAQTVDGVASSASSLGDSMSSVSDAASAASDSMDYWTDAVGNYDKGALEAIYTTEELVDMGFKTEEALSAEADAAEDAGDSFEDLGDAAEKAGSACENVQGSVSDLGDAAEDAGSQAEKAAEKGTDAVNAITQALAAAGIAVSLKEIAQAAYEMADAFSESESTIAKATGATGEALDDLQASAMAVSAASRTGSLEEISAALGEVNTRLGYTGEELEKTTELFVDFASVTGGTASTAVADITQLMNQWNIAADDMEDVMDKLVYAGQASGISVEELSADLVDNKAVLDQLGFSLDEAIGMFSNFEIAGTNASTVMTGLRSALTSGTISSLEDLYDIFEQISSGAMDSAEAAEIFGTRAGPQIVNAVEQGVFELDDFVDALETCEGTLDSTADASQTMSEKWEQATNSISTAFSEALSPAIEGISEAFANVLNKMGDFLNEHPAVTKAITALGVGLAAMVAVLGSVAAASAVATAATKALGTAMKTALPVVTGIVAAISAVVAIGTALYTVFQNNKEETISYTAATQEQIDELDRLQEEYDQLVEAGEAESREASNLKAQIDDLTQNIEENGQTIDEFCQSIEDSAQATQDLADNYAAQYEAIEQEELGTLALIEKLNNLATASDGSAASQAAMQDVIDQLNDSIDGLNLTYDDYIANQEAATDALREMAQAQAEQLKYEAMWNEYVDTLAQQEENTAKLAQAQDEVAAAEGKVADAQAAYVETVQGGGFAAIKAQMGWGEVGNALEDANEEYNNLIDAMNEAQDTVDETDAHLAELEEALGITSDELDDAADSADELERQLIEQERAEAESARQAVILGSAAGAVYAGLMDADTAARLYGVDADELNETLERQEERMEDIASACSAVDQGLMDAETAASMFGVSVAEMDLYQAEQTMNDLAQQLEDLKQAYDDAYSSAYNSIMGQISLTEALGSGMDDEERQVLTLSGATQTLLDSAAYIDQYNAALDTLSEKGLDATFIEEYCDTSEEGMQQAIDLANQLNDMTYDEANAAIEDLNTAYSTVQESASDTSDAFAETVTNYEKMAADIEAQLEELTNQVGADMEQILADMDKSDEAYKEGAAFAQSYADGILSGISAISTAAAQASAAGTIGSSTSVTAGAKGIVNAPNVMLTGEQGPELVARPTAAYAAGTTSSDDYFIAGENGPELIVGEQGSTVFPHSETDRLINALNGMESASVTQALPQAENYTPIAQVPLNGGSGDSGRDKKITLEIDGKGSIQVNGGGTDKETLVAFLYDYIKPVLMDVISEEIYEEGDLSYGY